MPKLSVIICCYNEQLTIEKIVRQSAAVELGREWEREIIVIDNCSTDGTQAILRQLELPGLIRIFHQVNMGKGMSVRTGIAHMSGDYMLIQDADDEYDPAEHTRFCAYATAHAPAALYGSRVVGGHAKYEYIHAYLGVRFLTTLTNLLFGSHLTDVATATKMVRADLATSLNLTCESFDLDFELTNKILLAGHTIHEIPISYDPRTYAEGKKIKTRDGVQAIWIMLRDRLRFSPVWPTQPSPKVEVEIL